MKIKIAINSSVTGKEDPDPRFKSKITYDYVVRELDCDELAEEIQQRHNICSVCLDENGKFHRNKKNFKSGQVLGIDIDNPDPARYFALDDALKDQFIKDNAYIIYTTPSHTEALNKFRLLFCLPQEITSEKEYSRIVTAFIARFGSDTNCKDASRFFYGTGKGGTVIAFGNVLLEETVAQILADNATVKTKTILCKTDCNDVPCDIEEHVIDIDEDKWKLVVSVFRVEFTDLINTGIRSNINKISSAKEGERNSLLNKHGYIIGSIISAATILGLDLATQKHLETLVKIGSNIGLPQEEATTAATNGFNKGLEQPDEVGMVYVGRYIDLLSYDNFEPLDDWFCYKILKSAAMSEQLGIGRLFAVLEYGNRLYDHTIDAWLAFNYGVWEVDETESTQKQLTGVIRSYFEGVALAGIARINLLKKKKEQDEKKENSNKEDFADQEGVIKSIESEMQYFSKAVEKLGRNKFVADCLQHTSRELAAVTTEFDYNPLLLNIENGTYDFQSFQFIPHDPKHLITHKIDVQYDPDAECPRWNTFIKDIFTYDEDLIAFVQRWVGYMLTGLTDQQYLFLSYGTGANGKTTFFKIVGKILGEYFAQIPIEILLDNKFGNNSVDYQMARIRGKRVVLSSEIPGGRFLNESQVKDITGGDKLTARQIYGKPFDYFPEFKLCLLGNHKPDIKGSDEGIWRRILLIPFAYTIPEEDRRPMEDVLNEFTVEIAGILNWAIEGVKQYEKYGGLEPPDSVTKAVTAYKDECDILGPFLSECTINTPKARTLLSEIWKSMGVFYEKIGDSIPIRSSRKLASLLRDRGYVVNKGAKNKTYVHGLGLITDKKEPGFIDGLGECLEEDVPF